MSAATSKGVKLNCPNCGGQTVRCDGLAVNVVQVFVAIGALHAAVFPLGFAHDDSEDGEGEDDE